MRPLMSVLSRHSRRRFGDTEPSLGGDQNTHQHTHTRATQKSPSKQHENFAHAFGEGAVCGGSGGSLGVRDNERRALGLLMLECLIRYISCAMMSDGAGSVTGALPSV